MARKLGTEASVQDRAEALNELKQHVSVEASAEAVVEVDRLLKQAAMAFPPETPGTQLPYGAECLRRVRPEQQ